MAEVVELTLDMRAEARRILSQAGIVDVPLEFATEEEIDALLAEETDG